MGFLKDILNRSEIKKLESKFINKYDSDEDEQIKIFKEKIKDISNEKKLILDLKEKYESGSLKEEEMTEEEIEKLNEFYDRQIEKLIISNEHKRQKIVKYRSQIECKY